MLTRTLAALVSLSVVFVAQTSISAESLNWTSAPLLGGKESLAESGFVLQRNLGVVNVAPEMRLDRKSVV